MLHDQELQDGVHQKESPKNNRQKQAAADQMDDDQQNNNQNNDQHLQVPQYMIMNNMESDTEEVYMQGKAYKKVGNDLRRGLTSIREGKKGSNADMQGKVKVDLEKFQELLAAKAKKVQDNTDEIDEPSKPDYQIFHIVEEQEYQAEMEELRKIQ